MFAFLVLLHLIALGQGCTVPTIANSTVLEVTANATYTVRCDEGFALTGVETLTCENGTVKEELPTCIKGSSSCSEPTIVKGSASLNDAKWSVECDAGFIINGTAELSCNSRTRKFVVLPNCIEEVVARNCSVPVVPKSKIFPNLPITNAMYKIACIQGYKLIGSQYLTCANGTIKEKMPTCVPDPFNCDAGSYFRRGSCELCPPNTYSQVKAVGCKKCGEGEVSSAGSKSASDCHIVVKAALPKLEAKPEKDEDEVDYPIVTGLGAGKGDDTECDGVRNSSTSSIRCYSNRIHASANTGNSVNEGQAVGDEESKQSFDMVIIVMISVIVVIAIVIVCVVIKFIILRPKPVYSPVTGGEEEVEMTIEPIDV